MTKKTISIVMATYNGAPYIDEQLSSIMQQSLLPDEIIILDDGSSDETKQKLITFQNKYNCRLRIELVFRKENTGYILNFIDGIIRANGDFIILSDQDDIWVEHKIEFTSSFFDQHEDCIALHSDTALISQDGELIKERWLNYTETSKLDIRSFIKRVNYPGMALAFRRDKLLPYISQINEFDSLFSSSHDWAISFISCLLDGFYLTNEVLSKRRYTGNNVALRLKKKHEMSLLDRINGIDIYLGHYYFAKEFLERFHISNFSIMRYIITFINRKNYLQNKNLLGVFGGVKNVLYYPSFKAYFADLLYILKG